MKVKPTIFLFFTISCILAQQQISEFMQETTLACQKDKTKNFKKTTLAYITPWNPNGYKLALDNANKIDIISPSWFQLIPEKLNGKFNTKIEGSTNIDTDFLQKIKEKNKKIKVTPRFNCQDFDMNSFQELYKEEALSQFIRVIIRRLKYNRFDGLVLECGYVFVIEQLYPNFVKLMQKLHEDLKKEKMILTLVLFPFSENIPNILSHQKFEFLSRYVDYFNIMTYDYISHIPETKQKTEKIKHSPESWVKKSLDLYIDPKKGNKDNLYKKVLIGIPFHGFIMDLTGDKTNGHPLNSEQLVQYLAMNKDGVLKWDRTEKEHTIDFSSGKSLFGAVYPTRKFLKARIELANKYNLGGVGLWDISMGMKCYLDEF